MHLSEGMIRHNRRVILDLPCDRQWILSSVCKSRTEVPVGLLLSQSQYCCSKFSRIVVVEKSISAFFSLEILSSASVAMLLFSAVYTEKH